MTVSPGVRSRPLAGRRVVITRAREQAGHLRRLLEEAGAVVLELPTIRIEPPESWEPLDRAIAEVERFHWIIFTSVNGVESVRHRLAAKAKGARDLDNARVAAIGPATAAALEEWGIRPELVPEEYRAEGLLERLRALIRPEDRVLLPRAAQARDLLATELERLGARVREVPAYRTLPVEEGAPALRSALAADQVDVVTFTSSSTARNFAAMFSEDERRSLFRNVVVACIGPITAGTAAEFGWDTRIMPSEYTIPGLVRAIIGYYSSHS